MNKKLTEELKQALEAFKNMPETDKLKLVNSFVLDITIEVLICLTWY